ncbi:hypothetical protein SeMB42_g01216 [Synchytrium endobioticum]|uniref:Uncharacterized protein n=1 Tax=Synchytrium endobioticum TaxID=286115 RepID=A0A507DM03_9FUNG|nr:hypothetical protein SeMB42_g01216 [Synchytrium endobioticum]
MNINIVLYVTAVIFIFRLAQGAPIPDDADIKKMIVDMQLKANYEAFHRCRFKYTKSMGRGLVQIPKSIEEIRSLAIPETSPYTREQLLNEPNEEPIPEIQRKFTKAYHALVFERLKTLFIRLQLLAHDGEHEEKDPLLGARLEMVWSALLKHYALESGYSGPNDHGNTRKIKLPSIDIPEQLPTHGPMKSLKSQISSYSTKVTQLEQKCRDKIDAMCRSEPDQRFHAATIRNVLNSEESRFRILEATKEWSTKLNYGALNQLVLEDRRWLPLWLAHEGLILARAQYDVARLKLYMTKCRKYAAKLPNRLYEYAVFIEDHKRKINVYSKSSGGLAMLQGGCVDDTVASSSKEAGKDGEALVRARSAIEPPSAASSSPSPSPGRYSSLGPHTLNDRTYVLDTTMVEDSGHRQPQTLNLLGQLDTRPPQHEGSLQPVEIGMLDRSSDVDTDLSLGWVSTAGQSCLPYENLCHNAWPAGHDSMNSVDGGNIDPDPCGVKRRRPASSIDTSRGHMRRKPSHEQIAES